MIKCFWLLASCLILLPGFGALTGRAQTGEPAPVLMLLEPALPAAGRERAAELREAVAKALLEAGLPAGVEIQDEAGVPPAPGGYLLVLRVQRCAGASCRLRLTFQTSVPFAPNFLSSALQATLLARYTPEIVDTGAPEEAARAGALAAGLVGYGTGNCEIALPLLDRESRRITAADYAARAALDFYRARCHHRMQDYAAATALLRDGLPLLPAGALDRGLRTLWWAALADALAQDFAFDRALRLDTRNIAAVLADQDSAPSSDSRDRERLLAELYLLRGRHRLYLYEWDKVLEDYEAALALPAAPAYAYYLRGLLYYTLDNRLAARDDFRRYLTGELDSTSPLIPLATRYIAALDALLATPQAE